jgi:hypothetical protein
MDSRYLSATWWRSYKHLRVGRLYIEWWGHSSWHAAKTLNFYQMALGRFSVAWSRFKCL